MLGAERIFIYFYGISAKSGNNDANLRVISAGHDKRHEVGLFRALKAWKAQYGVWFKDVFSI